MKMGTQVVLDLGRKAADDAQEAVWRTVVLLPDPIERARVAVFAAARVIALAAGTMQVEHDRDCKCGRTGHDVSKMMAIHLLQALADVPKAEMDAAQAKAASA